MMNKKDLSETDICAKYITPAAIQASWDEATQIRREVGFTKGRIIVRSKLVTRGKAKRADYVLYYQHIAVALIEAKDNHHALGDGMQQALDYATTLDVPFVFSSNGDGFVFHDRTGMSTAVETTLSLDQFPSPATLWAQYRVWKRLAPEQEKLIKATNHFADPDFDAEPVQIYEPGEGDPVTPPDDAPPTDDGEDAIPPEPSDEETVVDGYPPVDITLPPGVAEPPAKYYILLKGWSDICKSCFGDSRNTFFRPS